MAYKTQGGRSLAKIMSLNYARWFATTGAKVTNKQRKQAGKGK